MRKKYETPSAEIVKFQYSEQVVAQSGGGGGDRCRWWNVFGFSCETWGVPIIW